MKQTTLLAVALVIGGASLQAADPQLLNMTPPNAQMYAGINVDQAKTSQFGQFLLSNLPINADFENFITTTGFDPRNDIHEMLITTGKAGAVTGTTGAGFPSMLFAKGTFNIPQIVAAAAKEPNLIVSTYGGAQLISFTEGKQTQALALIDPSTAVAGAADDVQAALDRRTGTTVIPTAVMTRINQLSTTEDIWSVSTANFGALPIPGIGDGSGSAVLQSIQQASGGVKFGAQIQLVAQAVADNAQDAASLGDVVKLVAQMVQMHSSANATAPAQFTDLLKSMVVSTDGATLNVSLTAPEDQIESVFKMVESHTKLSAAPSI